MDAIRALNEGRCTSLTFTRWNNAQPPHWLHAPTNRCCSRACTKSSALRGAPRADRCQGQSARPAVPHGRRPHRCPLCQPPLGSGTRVLLEDLLAQEGLTGQHIAGFERDETSHTAIGTGRGQRCGRRGSGIEMAARARGWTLSPGGRALPPGLPEGNAGATSHPRASGLLLTRVWQDHGELAWVFTHAQRASAGDEQRPALVGFHPPQASVCA